MNSNNILTVADKKEKGISYATYIGRFNKAQKSGFYLECLWILYAMLEDRTSSILFYLGLTSNDKRSSVTGTKAIKSQIRDIFGMTKQTDKYRFNNISGKLQRINKLLLWSESEENIDTPYKKDLQKLLKLLAESDELTNAISFLEGEWREKRNQLTHSLFNKDPNSVITELKPLVENGYKAVRIIDKSVRKINKKGIRSKYKIQ